MAPRIGYLLPTREQIMAGRPQATPLIALAERAGRLGFDSIWVGDSLTARPRHEPFTLMAAVAARVPRVEIGTAVLLPALRNPVLLAHQVATLDQIAEGRFILGVGIAADVPNIRAEFAATGVPFEKRVGRMIEGLRLMRALWSGEPVDWNGRWKLEGQAIGPVPHRPGGPPLWYGGGPLPASIERAGRHFDGWMPTSGDAAEWARQWQEVLAAARAAGRDPAALTGSMYLTCAVDDDAGSANARLDAFFSGYYGEFGAMQRKRQAAFAGPAAALREWLQGYLTAGASHLVLRFAGDHERHLEIVAGLRPQLR